MRKRKKYPLGNSINVGCPLRKPECENRNCAWIILEKEKCGLLGLLLIFVRALREEEADIERARTEKDMGNKKEWMTSGEAAQFLGVHPNTVRNMAAKGELAAYRLPGSRGDRRFSRSELQRLREAPNTSP